MTTRSGKRNSQVTIQAPTVTTDARGGHPVTWAAVGAEVWAEVETVLSPEQIATMTVTAQITHMVTVPYSLALSAAKTTWRILWGTRVLQVASVDDVASRHRDLLFLCRETQVGL